MKWRVLLAVALLFAMAAVPASAAAPVSSDVDYVEEFMVVDCGGFEVWDYSEVHLAITDWFDQDGMPAMRFEQYRAHDVLYLSPDGPLDTYEVVATNLFSMERHLTVLSLDPFTFEEKFAGTIWDVTVPGQGSVYHESGQVTGIVNTADRAYTPVRRVGHFDEPEALCTALG